jgi:hypothetical protein
MNIKRIGIFVCFLFILSIIFTNVLGEYNSINDDDIQNNIVDSCYNTDEKTLNQIKSESNIYSMDSYLIDTEWGQWSPYNSKCPMNNQPGRPPFRERLGCWSVAIGQIINHHHEYYNLQSEGINDYLCTTTWIDPQHIVNDLDEYDYDWSQMANVLNGGSSDAEEDNVSRLLFDTATIIQKDFGTGGYCTISTTDDLTDLIDELIDHFPAVTALTEWDIDLTESEIKNEIDYGRPIMFYSIGHDLSNGDSFGHAWIIDGYRYNDSSGRSKFEVHFNYGWAGSNPDSLDDSWYYYYGNFPTFDANMTFDVTNYRRGLLIRLVPTPPSVFGPSNGIVGQPYEYTSTTVYDVNPPLYYRFDWDDGTYTDWLGRYDSGENCIATHTWKDKGTYEIKVKAKDVDGWESEWSNPLVVSMPRSKSFDYNPWLLRLIQCFPILELFL